MYVRRCYRTKNGKRHAYWALVESYRTARGPRQRVVAYLGELDAYGRVGVQQAAQPASPSQGHLFQPPTSPEWVEVDIRGVRVERSRQFGGCWLGLGLLRQLGLPQLLEELLPQGREGIGWSVMAQILVLGRMVDASSELRLAEHTYEQSALVDLLGVPAEKVNEDRLYRSLDRLLPHKTALEKHLQQAWVSCFSSTTTCCSTTSRALTLRAKRQPTHRRSAATRGITAPTASRSTLPWW